jgi:NNP family nitrate/nitrite transporter-like MFS transporter
MAVGTAGVNDEPRTSRREIANWDPADPERWDSKIAWVTLWVTTFNLMLAFIVWYLPGALIPKLSTVDGWELTKSQSYWLLAMPGLAGGFLRLVWMFLPPIMGTRRMLTMSSLLMLIPFAGWAWVVALPTMPSYGLLVALALAAGIGGGVFSGYMPSTSYFFPKAKLGTALGLQAGIGNFGVSVVQFVVPWALGLSMFGIAGKLTHVKNDAGELVPSSAPSYFSTPGLIFIPFAVVGVLLAWTMLRSVRVTANFRQQIDIFGNKHTWLMTMQYVMTFGIFSGLAATFGMLMKENFAGDHTGLIFLGAFVGSLARMCWGPLCDRYGGGVWTCVSGIGIAASATVVGLEFAKETPDFGTFLVGMISVFLFAGIGNASTFKQMPMIFPARQAGGVIGWTAAIAAFGPFLFGIIFSAVDPAAVFFVVAGYAVVCAVIAYVYYARRGAPARS